MTDNNVNKGGGGKRKEIFTHKRRFSQINIQLYRNYDETEFQSNVHLEYT